MEMLEAEQQNTPQMLFEQVVGLVLSSTTNTTQETLPWLNWSDAVLLVQVNRYCYTEYAHLRDAHLVPLLKHLEDSTGTNRHWRCGEPRSLRECTCDDDLSHYNNENWYNCPMCHNLVGVAFDPRYKDTYDDLPVFEKCAAIVNFFELIVRNIHSCFHWEDLSDPTKTSQAIGHPRDWAFFNQNDENYKNNHAIRQATFYMNLILIMYAKIALRDSNSLFFPPFNIAFWGLNDIDNFYPDAESDL